MRHVLSGVALGALLVLVGCNHWTQWRNPSQPPAGPHLAAGTPSAAELVTYLNNNSQRVQALECRNVDLDCTQGVQSVGLKAIMACQKPRNFRMAAKLMGNTEVDMGSNEQEFWYWIGKADPPYLFHCSHQDYSRGNVRMPFPFQPDWVMEALGMAEYDPRKNYQVAGGAGKIELIEQTLSPQGQPVQKVVVLNRSGNQLQVVAHLLRDQHGKEICSATIPEVQQDRATGAVLPRRVQLVWPDQHIKLKMRLEGLTANPQLEPQRTAALFSRPVMNGIQSYDLARGLDAGSPVRRAGGFMR